MRKGLSWMVKEEGVNKVRGKAKEVEKMRKGLSVIAGIAVLLFAYSASAAVETNGLVSWWKFEEGTNNLAYDTAPAGNNNTGTIYGNVQWTENTPGSASTNALSFGGVTNDYVDCGNDTSLNLTTGVTVEGWVKRAATGTEIPFSKDSSYYSKTVATVTDTSWHHVAFTWGSDVNSGKAQIYLDGTNLSLWQEDAWTGSLCVTTKKFFIGVCAWGSPFDGIIDEVRIYNRPLTQDEIQDNYNAIPEPSALLLLGGGLLGLLAFRRIRKRL